MLLGCRCRWHPIKFIIRCALVPGPALLRFSRQASLLSQWPWRRVQEAGWIAAT